MSGPIGELRGRRALVTGGGGGIGRGIALELARAGAGVALAARSRGPLEEAARAIEAAGARAAVLVADVTSEAQVRELAAAAARALGPVDLLVNAAGDAESAPFVRTDRALWERMIAANLTSVYLCTAALLPGMLERGWGRVLNVASSAGLSGHAYVSAYCAAKHGVVGLTRSVALEVAGRGVAINALCPGYVDTEMTRRSAERIEKRTGMPAARALARLASFNPSGRLLTVEEVAAAAMRLLDPRDGTINGEAVAV